MERQSPELRRDLNQRLQQLAMSIEFDFGHSASRSHGAPSILRSRKRLPQTLVFEDIEDARSRGNRLGAKRLFDVESQLGLREVLLKSLNSCDDSITKFKIAVAATIDSDP